MRGNERGFSLVELMIVVVIIGLIASVAVFMFTKQVNRSKAGEVHAVFADIEIQLDKFFTENGSYPISSFLIGDMFPNFIPMGEPAVVTGNSDWTLKLRMNFDKPALYCTYGVSQDLAHILSFTGSASILGSAVEAELTASAPSGAPIYGILARCNFDGDNVWSWYLKTSWIDRTLVGNPGE